MLFLVLVCFAASAFAEPKKFVIFVSSYGGGHISIANATKAQILKADPTAQVEIKDIYDFADQRFVKYEKWLFFNLSKKLPTLMNSITQNFLRGGNQARSLQDMNNVYDKQALKKYVQQANADAYLAVNFTAAQALGNLREEGMLRDVPVGYVVSELVEGYTPRIAQRLDKTFLPDPAFVPLFEDRGIPGERVATTGLPVHPHAKLPLEGGREKYLSERGLNPQAKTIVLASGLEGMGDFPAMIRNIAADRKGPLNVIAICGTNQGHRDKLEKMKAELAARGILLDVRGKVPNTDVLDAIKASDGFVGKPGGMLATEVMTIGRPAVFLDLLGNHEREIISRLGELGYGLTNRDPKALGSAVSRILDDETLVREMLAKQAAFRSSVPPEFKPIVDFMMNGKTTVKPFSTASTVPTKAAEALARLHEDSPAKVELLYSFPNQVSPESPKRYGKLAVRVGDFVYSVAKNEKGEAILQRSSLVDYLYAETGHGIARDHNTLSLRLNQLPAGSEEAIAKSVERLAAGTHGTYSGPESESIKSARLISQVLHAGGFALAGTRPDPLSLFERVRNQAKSESRSGTLVNYAQLRPEGQANPGVAPLSRANPLRSALSNFIRTQDPLEQEVQKRIELDVTRGELVYDNLDHKRQTATTASEPAAPVTPPAPADPYLPQAKMPFGPDRGKPLATERARAILPLPASERARYEAKPSDTVVANFVHDGKLWIARIPAEGVEDAYLLSSKLFGMSTIVHTSLRFKMKPGYAVQLFPQPGDGSQPVIAHEIRDLIFSADALGTSNQSFDPKKAMSGKYVSVAHLQSTDETFYDTSVALRTPIEQNLLKLTDAQKTKLFGAAIQRAVSENYRKPYSLFSGNCTTEAYELLDEAVPNRYPAKALSALNFLPYLPNTFLRMRGLYSAEKQLNLETLYKGTPVEAQAKARFREFLKQRKEDRKQERLAAAAPPTPPEPEHGMVGGPRAEGTAEALAALDRAVPAEVELILGNAVAPKHASPYGYKNLREGSGHPFGHIALRIGDKVYNIVWQAKPGQNPELIAATSLDEYLFGNRPEAANAEFGVDFGGAYVRDSLGLRIGNVSPEAIKAMLAEIARINQRWLEGNAKYHASQFNCADFVYSVLRQGGLVPPERASVTYPVDVVRLAEQKNKVRGQPVAVVTYPRLPESRNRMVNQGFPISLGVHALQKTLQSLFGFEDPLLNKVTHQVAGEPGSRKVRCREKFGVIAGVPAPVRHAQAR